MKETQDQPTTTDAMLPVKIEPLVALVQEYGPKMIKGRDRAVAALEKITEVTEANIEDTTQLLVKAKQTSDIIQKWRKEVTGPLDEIKKSLMTYEKDIIDQEDRVRKEIGKFKQQQLDAIRAEEERARKLREREDYKTDLTVIMRKNLQDMVMSIIVSTDEQSEKFFATATVDDFDEKAKRYATMKPVLKQPLYDKCFEIAFDGAKITPEEFKALVASVQLNETFAKYEGLVIDGCIPVINQWRGKIPDLKLKKIELEKAKDDAAKLQALQEQQRKEQESEQARKKAEFEEKRKVANEELNQQAEVDKMGNAFQEQAMTQTLEDKGPVKKVLKFNNPKLMGKAFNTIVYHVMASPKFGGFQKREPRTKELVYDDKGRPEYIDQVQWWINQFMSLKIDAHIEGTEVLEDSKVIVRK